MNTCSREHISTFSMYMSRGNREVRSGGGREGMRGDMCANPKIVTE